MVRLPVAKTAEPATPGERVPPELTVTDPLTPPVPPSVPEALTVTAPVPAPEPLALFISSVPALMTSPPLKVFAPLKARVPAPALVRLNAPEIMPPSVSVLAIAVTMLLAPKVTAPVPKFRLFAPLNVKSPPQV